MPLREEPVDRGFSVFTKPQGQPPEEEKSWLSHAASFGSIFQSKTWGSAFELENPVVGAFDAMTKPQFEADPTFNLPSHLKTEDLWEDREFFLGTSSWDEFQFRKTQIAEEKKQRETLSDAGLGGFVAMMGAGLLSPSVFLPFVGQARGVQALMQGAAWGMAGAIADEIPLQADQSTRTGNDLIGNAVAGLVVGGTLGGAIGYVRSRRAGMASSRGEQAISKPEQDALDREPEVAIGRLEIEKHARLAEAQKNNATTEELDEIVDDFDTQIATVRASAPEPAAQFDPEVMRPSEDEVTATVRSAVNERLGPEVQPRFDAVVQQVDSFLTRNPGGPLGKALRALRKEIVEDTTTPLSDKLARVEERVAALEGPEGLLTSVRLLVKNAVDTAIVIASEETQRVRSAIDNEIAEFDPTLSRTASDDPADQLVAGMRAKWDDFVTREAQPASAIPAARAAGAAARDVAPMGLAGTFGAQKVIGSRNAAARVIGSPVVRVLSQKLLPMGQWIMAQLADAGLETQAAKRGMAVTEGGTAESRINAHWGKVATAFHKLDGFFNDYYFEGGGGPLKNVRSAVGGLNPNRTKMSKREFRAEVSRAMFNGDKSEIPEVAAAAAMMRAEVYDPIFEMAQKEGIYKSAEGDNLLDEGEGTDLSYLNRIYNTQMIKMRQLEFIDLLAAHFENKLQTQWQAGFGRFVEANARDTEALGDLRMSGPEVEKARAELEASLERLELSRPERIVDLEEAIYDRRKAAQDEGISAGDKAKILEEARQMEALGGDELKTTKQQRAAIKRRLRNLTKSRVAVEERQAAKLAKIERSEELQINSLRRLVGKGRKLLNKLDNVSDEVFDAEVEKLKNQFADTGAKFDKAEENLQKVFDDEFEIDKPTGPFLSAFKAQTERFDRMNELVERLELAQSGANRSEVRQAINDILDEALAKTQGLNARRAVRASRLAEQADKLDPKLVDERIAKIADRIPERREKFVDEWRKSGLDDVDWETGKADFRPYAREIAQATTNKILGTHMRLAGMDLLMEPRGAELMRTLDIDSNVLFDRGFLETDVEKLAASYIRTLAPDIELHKKLGDYALNPWDGEPGKGARNEKFQALDDQYLARLQMMQEDMKAKGRTQAQIDKRSAKMRAEYDQTRKDINTIIGRLRHTWGIPKEPDGAIERLGRVVMNLNVLAQMGMVTVSSIPDVARPIMKYGMTRALRDGWVPFIQNLPKMIDGIPTREMRLANVATDLVLHSRAHQILDIGDYMVRGGKVEKAIEWGTSKIGLIAFFDYWTTMGKQVTGMTVNAKLMDSLEILHMDADALKQARVKEEDIAEATRFLAGNGINGDIAATIWRELNKPGGSNRVKGVLWPNTEAWDNAGGAIDAYRQALVREVDNTIVTPGVEKATFTDANLFGRMVSQFRSFGLASTSRTTMAGLQRHDMAFVTGSAISLALGAVSYYLSANIAGGYAKERLDKAIADGNWGLFVDEAMNRSGLFGIGSEMQTVLSNMSILGIPDGQGGRRSPFTVSGDSISRFAPDNVTSSILGPSAGHVEDLVKLQAEYASEGGPTQGTLRRTFNFFPLQNHLILRQAYDAIEKNSGLPERR